MKQSKKILSIFLAMLMLLGTVSVVGSAAKEEFSKSTIQYDSIDNAKLSAEQVADIVLDMVDEMLAGIDLSDITKITDLLSIKLDLNSVDGAFKTLVSNEGLLTGSLIAGDGNLADLDVSALEDKTRSSVGDIAMVCGLLQFLADNFGDGAGIENAVYGVDRDRDDGVCFGVGKLLWTGKAIGIVDLNFSVEEIVNDPDLLGLGMSVNALLDDLPSFLKSLIFDLLIYGSYPYSSDGVNKEYSEVSGDFSGKSIEQMLSIILKNFLTAPQKYEYNESGKKVWDLDSYLISADKYNSLNLGDDFISENSLLDFVDKIIQIAYEDFGTVALNHDVKKLFMEAMEVEFVEVEKDSAEYKKIIADPDYVDVTKSGVDVSSVKNYFCNAQMWEVDGVWYFRDYVTRDVLDAEGNPVFDAEGNVKTELQHRFQRAEAYTANELYNIFNWNYEFTDDTFDFDKMIQTEYKSIIGSLNHILHVILEKAINPAYLTSVGITSIDQLWVDGGNENFNENVVATAKFVIENFAFQFFGRNEAYVDLTTFKANDALKAALKNCNTIESLVAYIGLPLLADVLPQLVYDVELFTPGLEIEQTAALLVREFLSDLTPVVNYDAEIFADPTLSNGRAFKEHSSAEWMDIVLNMGLDLAMIYLDNITNIDVTKEGLEALHGVATAKGVQPWKVVLEEIVDWAVLYIGNGDVSALTSVDAEGNTFALSPNNLGAIRCVTDGKTANADNYAGNAFATLSTALNAILPLGFLCGGVDSDNYALDVALLFDKILVFVTELNLETLLGLFGRNTRTDNIFTQDNVLAQVLGLVNKLLGSVFGRNLFEDTSSVTAIVDQDNLAALLVNLIDGLSDRSNHLLVSLLPTVAQFVPDWGGEQTFRAPSTGLDGTYNLSNGARNDITFDITNGSKRVWRSYVDASGNRQQDEQYAITVKEIKAFNHDGTASPYVTVTTTPSGAITYGASKEAKFNVANVPATGALVRFDISYTVTNGMTTAELPGTYTKSEYVWFNYSDSEDNYVNKTSNQQNNKVFSPFYVNIDNGIGQLTEMTTIQLHRDSATTGKTTQPAAVTVKSTATQFGITFEGASTDIKKDTTIDYKTFKVDEATFAKDFAAANVSGGSLEWTVEIKAYEETGDFKIYLSVYSGKALDALREIVDYEVGQMRLPSDYDTSKDAWVNYANAFQTAFAAARQRHDVNAVSRLDYAKYAADLEAAAEAVEKVKKTETNAGTMIDTLAATVKSVEGELNGKDYRTYALYRWHRFYDVLKSARNIIELDRRAELGLETMNYNYSGLTANEVSKLVAGDKYEAYIKALFVAKTEEEALEAKNQYNNIRSDLASVQMIDIANTNALLPALQDRLVAREGGVVKTYLEKEINSAKATFKDLSQYSEMSKAAYETALANAEAAMNSDSQDVVFAAKYALQVARNNLRTSAQEADYTELLRLMDQAKAALAQPAGTYTNGNADLGAVVAALGYEVKDASNNTVQLFPDSAMVVSTRSYDKHDQDEVDDAADALKVALAKLQFASFKPADNGFEVENLPTGEEDDKGDAILAELKTKTVEKEKSLDAVKELVKVSGFKVEVSLDDKYTSQDESTGIFVGTGATITVFKEEGTAKIPVATIKVVVNGDVNGDGTIDVLDCMAVELATHGYTSFAGAYNAAANLHGDATSGIDANDLGQVVNIAKG